MAKILEGVGSIDGKLAGVHGVGEAGFFYDSTGFWIAPPGKSARTASGGNTGAPGAPSITLSRTQSIAGIGNTHIDGATFDTLASYVLPKNSLSRNGQCVRVIARGSVAANGNTKQIRINFGSVVFVICNSGNTNAALWEAEAIVTRTGSKLQVGLLKVSANGTTVTGFAVAKSDGNGNVAVLSMAQDDTTDLTLNVQAVSGTAANDILLNDFQVVMEGN